MFDLETNAVRAVMGSNEMQTLMQRMNSKSLEGNAWDIRVAEGQDKLAELGLDSIPHPRIPKALVAFMQGTRRKMPPCLVLNMTDRTAEVSSVLDLHIGHGLLQLIPKGEINVSLERDR